MGLIRLCGRFLITNPVFSLYAIGIKVIIVSAIYYDVKEKMRNKGRELANV